MAKLLDGLENAPNRVEFYRRKKWLVATFATPGEAYRFWLALPRKVQAVLFQDAKVTGRGNGLESN